MGRAKKMMPTKVCIGCGKTFSKNVGKTYLSWSKSVHCSFRCRCIFLHEKQSNMWKSLATPRYKKKELED